MKIKALSMVLQPQVCHEIGVGRRSDLVMWIFATKAFNGETCDARRLRTFFQACGQ